MHIPQILPRNRMQDIPVSHRPVLRRVVDHWKADPATKAILLVGSLARGDSLPSSDIDLVVIVKGEGVGEATHAYDGDILVETSIQSLDTIRERLTAKPKNLYGYLVGKILYDTDVADVLAYIAGTVWDAYRIVPEDIQIAYIWLKKIRGKLLAYMKQDNELAVGYLVAHTAAEILSNLFVRAGCPPPGNGGAALYFMRELEDYQVVQRMYVGTTNKRAEATIELINKLLAWFDEQGFDTTKLV